MDILDSLKVNVQNAFKELGHEVQLNDIIIEVSKDPTHGDYATNCAMKFSRFFQTNPRAVAELIIPKLDMSSIDKVEIAGPGFINFYMKQDSLSKIVNEVITKDASFGAGEKKNKKINVEFVSANPTGLLHVGTARGAAIGDCISRILAFNGYDVTKEYYINDAGMQITHLAESIYARYLQELGMNAEMPEDGYWGDDVIDIAKQLIQEKGKDLISMDDAERMEFLKQYGIKLELGRIIEHLKAFRVEFDVFSSEKAIRADNAIEKEIKFLGDNVYQDDGALFLKTTNYLDDKDRVIRKKDGEYTYFMPDICYHVNKLSRGFDNLIDVLGADHHGYINRMKSALMMHGYDKDVLHIELIQMVRFLKNGVEFKASKRSGDAITLHEICEEVGVDAMRYFFAMRAASTHMDFDMDLAKEQSSNNPVYYSQYAHARLCSVLETGKDIKLDVSGSLLKEPSETELLKNIAKFPKVVEDAGNTKSPYKITNYIHDLAESVHSFYNCCHVIDRDNLALSGNRLALCKATKIVIKNALNLLGVSAPEHM
ncbi:MAG: arginine--tRNA ligase [Bacilli bacterium]|nr:arginine--tRNA ligase [Bacilli bacterium]